MRLTASMILRSRRSMVGQAQDRRIAGNQNCFGPFAGIGDGGSLMVGGSSEKKRWELVISTIVQSDSAGDTSRFLWR